MQNTAVNVLADNSSIPPGFRTFINDPDQMRKAWNQLAKDDYSFYVEYTHRGLYQHGRHTKVICNVLQRVETGELKRVIIATPPRHSKSMTVTESFPSYFIGRDPHRRVIQVSYADTLARKFGAANKTKVEEYGLGVFNVKISRSVSASNNWDIQGFRGGMISTGIGGSITGQGADLLLIDDPIKNKEEAESKTYRDKIWNEWQNTLRTRLHPGAAVVIIMTRWHEDDLVGRLQNPDYGEVEDWTIINLPAIAEENDYMGREVGEPLWPEHGFDLAWAKSTENAVGSATWASLYQQRPAAAKGNMIHREWFRRYSIPYNPETNTIGVFTNSEGNYIEYYMDEIIQSWDMSFKDSEGTDMVVGQVWGRSGANKFLIDQIRGRKDFPTTLQAVKILSARYPMARLKLVEDKANGPGIIAMLNNKIGGMLGINPEGSKVARMSSVTIDFEAGNVFIPTKELATWVDAYEDELCSFPKATFDDQADASSQALARLAFSRASHQPPKENKMTSDQLKIHNHIQSMIKKVNKKNKVTGKYSRNYLAR